MNESKQQITGVMIASRPKRRPQCPPPGAIRQFQFHECTDLRNRVKRLPISA
jgi:hypothetical protein